MLLTLYILDPTAAAANVNETLTRTRVMWKIQNSLSARNQFECRRSTTLHHLFYLFQLICSYVFMPLAVAIGIPWSETGTVGILIGKKIFLNEFLAYADLGAMLKTGEISVSQ